MEGIKLNLHTQAPYIGRNLDELQAERFQQGMPYYVCVIKTRGKTHLYDAAQLIEACIENNSLINTAIKDRNIRVLVSSRDAPDFRLYKQGREVLKAPNHFPVLWNDPSRPKEHRLGFKYLYAKSLERQDPMEAVRLYRDAATEGSTAAKVKLGVLYFDSGEMGAAREYFLQALESDDISNQNALFCKQQLAAIESNARVGE